MTNVVDDLTMAMDAPADVPFSEDDLANRFSALYAGDLRYIAVWGRWFEWAGNRWREDDTVKVFDLVRAICRKAASEANTGSRTLARANTVAAVERLARADRRHAARVDEWDAEPWLLNTPGGTVDLRSGDIRPHRPADHITRITAAEPQGECPSWLAFLNQITAGDGELITFLQRVAGYCATGSTREHALFFLYGTGSNGKSVFRNVLAGIFADYHRTASVETFMMTHGERHPTDLAMLRGARLVTAPETEKGRYWAEARIKQLTGGDPVAARFMRQDFFEYVPQFKLLISGNHKPQLRTVDEAIRRRMHLIPFTVTIPPDQQDHDLQDKLRVEWGGILRWIIDGAVEWYMSGLQPPAAVVEATRDYLTAEDVIAVWLDERMQLDPNAEMLSSDAFGSFRDWCEGSGEKPGTQKGFSEALLSRGFVKRRTRNGAVFDGLRPR